MLTREQKHRLVAQSSKLNPIVMIGNKGLTPAVHIEIERALHDHELVKIKFLIKDRLFQAEASQEICKEHQADLVNHIGHVVVIYRKNLDTSQ